MFFRKKYLHNSMLPKLTILIIGYLHLYFATNNYGLLFALTIGSTLTNLLIDQGAHIFTGITQSCTDRSKYPDTTRFGSLFTYWALPKDVRPIIAVNAAVFLLAGLNGNLYLWTALLVGNSPLHPSCTPRYIRSVHPTASVSDFDAWKIYIGWITSSLRKTN